MNVKPRFSGGLSSILPFNKGAFWNGKLLLIFLIIPLVFSWRVADVFFEVSVEV